MNATFKSFFYKVGILLLLICLVIIYNYFTDTPKTKQKDVKPTDIDYFATHVETTQYNEKGLVDYKITAEKLSHIESTDIGYLTSPTAHLYKENENPWFISSNLGEIGPKGDTVKLINNVKGIQTDPKGQDNTFTIGQVKNQEDPTHYGDVMIYPDKKFAESSDYAIVTSIDGETSGVGVKAYLDTNQIKFLSKVRTHIVRNQNATN